MVAGVFALLVAALLFLSLYSLGGAVVSQNFAGSDRSDRVSLRILAGAALFAPFLFVVGLWQFSLVTILAIILLPLVFNWRQLAAFGWLKREEISLVSLVVGAVTVVLVVAGMAELVGSTEHDSVRYHLLAPQVWLRDGYVHVLPYESHTAFPAVIEILFGASMALSERAPGVVGALFILLALAQVRGVVGELGGGRSASQIATLLLVSMPVALVNIEEGFVDLPFALFSIAALRLAFSTSPGWLAGIYGGAAMGTKYTGIMVVATIAVLLLFMPSKRSDKLTKLLSFLVVAGVIASPWYVRNFIVYGTPIFPPPPFFAEILPVQGMTADEAANFHAGIFERGKGLGTGVLDLLLLPFRLIYFPAYFHGAGGYGFALLALAPIGVALRWFDSRARWYLGWSLCFTLVWFITQQEARFLVVVALIAAGFAAVAAEYLITRAYLLRVLTALILVASIVYGLSFVVRPRLEKLPVVFSESMAEKRREVSIPFYDAMQYLNQNTDVRSVLILRGAAPGYYLNKPFDILRPSSQLDGSQLKNIKESHILDTKLRGGWIVREAGSLELVFESSDARIYRLKD